MAKQPLFNRNLEELKSALRLSGVCDVSSDASAIIDQAVLVVRGHFYRRLGLARVAELLTFAVSDNPTTEPEILRSIACTTEIKWVKRELLLTLPTHFADGGGSTLKAYNEEAPFRTNSEINIASQRKELREEIEENLEMLSGSETTGNETHVHVFDGTPDTTPCKPYDSIRNKSYWGWQE